MYDVRMWITWFALTLIRIILAITIYSQTPSKLSESVVLREEQLITQTRTLKKV